MRKESKMVEYKEGTWIDNEAVCYPSGNEIRKFRAICGGKFVNGKCGIADTFFTIPAKIVEKRKTVRGYLTVNEEVLIFNKGKENVPS